MTIYRRLLFFERVRPSDEVLNTFGQREWTLVHGYSSMLVKDCFGYVTGGRRKFRRIIWRTR